MIMSVYLLCLVIVSVLPAAYSLDFGAFAKCSDDCSPEKVGHLPYSKAWLLEVADQVCDLEKPSLVVGKVR